MTNDDDKGFSPGGEAADAASETGTELTNKAKGAAAGAAGGAIAGAKGLKGAIGKKAAAAKDAAGGLTDKASEAAANAKDTATSAKDKAGAASASAKDTASAAAANAKDTATSAKDKAGAASASANDTASAAAGTVTAAKASGTAKSAAIASSAATSKDDKGAAVGSGAGASRTGGAAAASSGGSGGAGGGGDKLVPGWGASGDNQIVIIGVAVVGLLSLLIGWNSWRGGDDSPVDLATVTNSDQATDSGDTASIDLTGPGLAAIASSYGVSATHTGGVALLTGEVDSQATKDAAGLDALAVPGISEVDNRLQILSGNEPETAEPETDLDPAVAAATAAYSISSSVNGDVAILEGSVPTEADSTSAEADALAVDGIRSVDNRLTVMQPAVLAALTGAGTAEASVEMDGNTAVVSGVVDDQAAHDSAISAAEAVPGITEVIDELLIIQPSVDSIMGEAKGQGLAGTTSGQVVTLTGVLNTEDDRAGIVASAQAIEGVTEVVDQMTVDTTVTDLNALFELEPIQFATSSSVILEESFGTLDRAVEILSGVTDRNFEIQGYTDVRGPDSDNLALSQARADSVLAYLTDNGVDPATLTSVGYGETTEFGEGDSAEALSLNRRVQFAER